MSTTSTPTLRSPRALLAVVGATFALTGALGACGSSDGAASGEVASLAADGGDATTSTTTAAASEEELLAYTECLRDQGLDVPDPEVDANGNLSLGGPGGGPAGGGGEGDADGAQPAFDREDLQAAQEECGEPPAMGGGFDRGDDTEFQDAALEFAQCMRDNGVDVPDPDFSQAPDPGSADAGSTDPGGQGGPGGGPFGELDQDDPEVQAALDECQQVFAAAGLGAPGQAGPSDEEAG